MRSDLLGRRFPTDEVFGIDFRHAVEFSRSGCTPRRSASASFWGNCPNLHAVVLPGYTGVFLSFCQSLGGVRSATLGLGCPGTDHRFRCSFLPVGREENIRACTPRGSNRGPLCPFHPCHRALSAAHDQEVAVEPILLCWNGFWVLDTKIIEVCTTL